MDYKRLIERLVRGENLHTEFKEWPLHPNQLASEIVAFSNTDGGLILLGINDRGEIVGIDEDLDTLSQKIDNIAYHHCEPPITITQEFIQTPINQSVIVISVAKGAQRPYRTNQGIYYTRTSSGKRQASREELLRLYQATESLYYDETPLFKSSYSDLLEVHLKNLLKTAAIQGIDTQVITRENLLVNWRLVIERPGHYIPTLAGMLFLGDDPQFYLPLAYISAVRIPGLDISGEPLDQKHIDGTMKQMLEDAMRFLKIHLRTPHKIHHLQPEKQLEFPVESLRESLVNALSHRDYTISSPIRLIIYDDRLEIRTPGLLPNSVTLTALPFGVHVLRNPTIYNMFLRLGLVTDVGSGIPRIMRLVKEHTGDDVSLQLQGNEFVVIFPRKVG